MKDEITESKIVSSGAGVFVASRLEPPKPFFQEEEIQSLAMPYDEVALLAEEDTPNDDEESVSDDVIPKGDDEISDDSDTGRSTCSIIFSYQDTDGVEKIFGEVLTVEYGTSYSSITPPGGYPTLSSGYWIFTGWTETFSSTTKVVTGNITSKAKFEAAKVKIPLNWNGATNATSDSYLECVWGERYSNLPVLPEKKDSKNKVIATFSGAYLITDILGQVIARTHDASGAGITIVGSAELGSETSNEIGHVFEAPSCKIAVCWVDPVKWNTQEDLRSAVGALPCPFASDESATVEIPATADGSNDISFSAGFPESYAKPIIVPSTGEVDKTARVITRRQVNTLGYIGTQEQFFAQCGGYHTFDEKVCAAIGGYPETAILKFFDESNNCLRTVYSLMNDNTWNFLTDGVDGVHWKYIDDNPILSMRVDYSEFLDLRDTLFVETGLPDFYELPYDGMLQLHALSFCDMHSTIRDEEEYISGVVTSTEKTDGEFVPVYEDIQGAFATPFKGNVYLDIYNAKTNTITSSEIRQDGSLTFGASVTDLSSGKCVYYYYKMPRYVVTQGTFMLNKGDKIRVRGIYQEIKATTHLGDISRVYPRVLSDMEVRRFYLCKFANYYRVGWEA